MARSLPESSLCACSRSAGVLTFMHIRWGLPKRSSFPRADDSRAERRYDLLQRCLALELLAQSLEQRGVIAAEQRVQSVTVVNDGQRRVERSQPGEQRGRHERHVAGAHDERPALGFPQCGDNPAQRVVRARRLAQYAAVEIGKRRVGLCHHHRLEAGGPHRLDWIGRQGVPSKTGRRLGAVQASRLSPGEHYAERRTQPILSSAHLAMIHDRPR